MSSKTFHIISIALSILSILFSIMTYFGIIRYIKLYMTKSVDRYAEKYTDLPVATEKRTVIVLSVENQSDIDRIIPTVNSLLEQTVRVNQIFIVLPCESNCVVPDSLKKVLTVIKPGKVYDEQHQDLISVLQREKEKNTLIIKASKGIIYGQDFIQNVIEKSEEHPESIIRDESDLFMLIKPEFIILDDNSTFIEFGSDIKNMTCNETYKY